MCIKSLLSAKIKIKQEKSKLNESERTSIFLD